MGTLLFSFVATNLAGFSVPVEVGGARLAYAATASEAEVLSSYPPTTLPLPTTSLSPTTHPITASTYHRATTYLNTYHPPPTLHSFTPAPHLTHLTPGPLG